MPEPDNINKRASNWIIGFLIVFLIYCVSFGPVAYVFDRFAPYNKKISDFIRAFYYPHGMLMYYSEDYFNYIKMWVAMGNYPHKAFKREIDRRGFFDDQDF